MELENLLNQYYTQQAMTLLKEHKKKLKYARRSLEQAPGLEGYWLLSYARKFYTDDVNHVISESRQKAYSSMIESIWYANDLEKDAFYIITRIEKKPRYFEENLIPFKELKNQIGLGKIVEQERSLRIIKIYGPFGIERIKENIVKTLRNNKVPNRYQ